MRFLKSRTIINLSLNLCN